MSQEDDVRKQIETAKREIVRAQAQYVAIVERMTDYKELFREERDDAVKEGLRRGVSKTWIATELGVTPQWLNKLLRGDAYRRRSD